MSSLMKMSSGERIFQCILILFVTFLCIVTVYPFLHIASVSLSRVKRVVSGFHVYPRELDFFAWNQVLSQTKIWIGFGNSVFRTIVGTAMSLIAMSLCAYPLSRKYLPHRAFYTMVILFTMFFGAASFRRIC